mgnify:CR=1 FL=1
MRHVPFIDLTGMNNFKEVINLLKKERVKIILSGVRTSLLKDFKSGGIVTLVDESNIFHSFSQAVAHSKEIIKEVNK